MPNTLLTSDMIAREALFQLENNITVGGLVHTDYKDEFVKVGDTVSIRKPVQFRAVAGATLTEQDIVEETTNIVIDQRFHVGWNLTSQQMTLDVEEFGERYLKGAMIQLANKVEEKLLEEGAKEFFNVVGTAGTTPGSYDAVSEVAERMDLMAVPDDMERYGVLDPRARHGLNRAFVKNGNEGLRHDPSTEPMLRRAKLGELSNITMYGSQNVHKLTFGARPNTVGGVGLVNATLAEGAASVAFDGADSNSATYLRKGDVITFAGVNAVNPVNKADDGRLAEFVVTADVVTASAAGTIPIYPAMYASSTDPRKNVTALPADNAAITVVRGTSGAGANGVHPQNLFFHRNALALVTVPLEIPEGSVDAGEANWRGYQMRCIKDYDISSDTMKIRLDILFGVKAIYPELGVRLFG